LIAASKKDGGQGQVSGISSFMVKNPEGDSATLAFIASWTGAGRLAAGLMGRELGVGEGGKQ
jgi:hypothetical protein